MTQDNNQKLQDVETLLKKLQSFEEENANTKAAKNNNNTSSQSTVSSSIIISSLAVVAVCSIGVLIYLGQDKITSYFSQTSQKGEANNKSFATQGQEMGSSEKALSLEKARELIKRGEILAAREQLVTLTAQGNPDAAFAMARTYDPNVLRTIPNALAYADKSKARLWYKKWHGLGKAKGVVTLSDEKLERLLLPLR